MQAGEGLDGSPRTLLFSAKYDIIVALQKHSRLSDH